MATSVESLPYRDKYPEKPSPYDVTPKMISPSVGRSWPCVWGECADCTREDCACYHHGRGSY